MKATSLILSVHSAHTSSSYIFWLAEIQEALRDQMSYKAKTSSTSSHMCILWWCIIFIQTYFVVWHKNPWYPALCTGETQSSFAWEMHQSLRENILGPQKRKKGPVRTRGYPPRTLFLPIPSYCNNTSPFDISGSWSLHRVSSRRLPCDAETDGSWSPGEEDGRTV